MDEDILAEHRAAVEGALRAGEAVPLRVLADYPELVEEYGGRSTVRLSGVGDWPVKEEAEGAESGDESGPDSPEPEAANGSAIVEEVLGRTLAAGVRLSLEAQERVKARLEDFSKKAGGGYLPPYC